MSKLRDPNLPPSRDEIRNLGEMFIMEIDSYEIVEWHPAEDGGGEPTQVHFLLKFKDPELPLFMLRLKSRKAAEALIAALMRHTLSVWPDSETQ